MSDRRGETVRGKMLRRARRRFWRIAAGARHADKALRGGWRQDRRNTD